MNENARITLVERTTAARRSVLAIAFTVALAAPADAQVGSCTAAVGEAYLDVNNVRARILNNGNLFYRGEPHVYEVPKGSGKVALFTGGFWLGGKVNGELRVAAANYGRYEFWAGPIDESGNPPADCSVYDKIWKISRSDVEAFESGGPPATDLATWPTGLGAPTLAPADGDLVDNDHDGQIDEQGEMKEIHKEVLLQPLAARVNRVIDLDAGERPQLHGDQTLWWIMNDRGNTHEHSITPPVGVEVHGMAFAFDQPGDLGTTTFYKLSVFMKATDPLDEAYVSIWSDPDLGDFQDDYIGSDTTLGLGYVYNADNLDGSASGYGEAPPAVGYDFVQGPIVPSVGDTAHVSGVAVADFRNLKMTSFLRFTGYGPMSDPVDGHEVYAMMTGRWKDGKPIRASGDGYNVPDTVPVTKFMFTGDPATGQFWSEVNSDGNGTPTQSADRRFMMSSGPFTINPGDQQEIFYSIVWARGLHNFDSVARLRTANMIAQSVSDGFPDTNTAVDEVPPARVEGGIMSVYPTPVAAERGGGALVTVEYGHPMNEAGTPQLEIFDALARRVQPSSWFATGLYFVRLRFGDGQLTAARKLVVSEPGTIQFEVRRD